MSDQSVPSARARAAVDAILARDGLRLATEDYEWPVAQYDEKQAQLQSLRAAAFRDFEPAVTHIV